MNKLIYTILGTVYVLVLLYSVPSLTYSQHDNDFTYHRGVILSTLKEEKTKLAQIDDSQMYKKLEIEITDGDRKGDVIEVEVHGLESVMEYQYADGDRVILSGHKAYDSSEAYTIVSYDRQNTLWLLFILFLVIALAISYKRTIGSLLGLIFSFFIIFTFLIPRILDGANPVFLSILSAIFIIPVSFSLSHGINRKTFAAILGTIIALVITGILAMVFMSWANITGQGSEEAMFISTVINKKIDIQGLFLAGVIIGTLGVLDDITISQVAIVEQISQVAEKLKKNELFMRAMRIGQDHMASMINTLVLVYAGASMPILLIFVNSDLPINYLLSLETISMEIIRTLVGTIGLMSAIPISTFLGILFFKKEKDTLFKS